MTDTNYVTVYNSKRFRIDSTSDESLRLAGGISSYKSSGAILSTYHNSALHLDTIYNLGNGGLSIDAPENLWPIYDGMCIYSRGMGAMGLPGDLSSMSRFVRASFTKMHSVSGTSESESISQFFHILESVAQQRGCVRLEENTYELTIYTSCCNMDQGIYYYTTYDNHQITAVDMNRENLSGNRLIAYPLVQSQHIYWQN